MNGKAPRAAVVTGAAQGLGRAIALRLLRDGIDVVGADLQEEKLFAFRGDLGELAGRFHPVAGNIGTAAGAAAAIGAALSLHGRLDVLVNTAGGSGTTPIREIDDLDEDAWNKVLEANIGATYHCTRAAVPHMRKAGHGRIVNFSSDLVMGTFGWVATVGARLAYCAAKGAIEGFSRQLAKDLRRTGITVNVIVPGFVLTEPGARVHDRFRQLSNEEKSLILHGRTEEEIARAEDVAEAVVFLASKATGQVNGTFLRVGG